MPIKKRHIIEVLGSGDGLEWDDNKMGKNKFVGIFWDLISFFSHNNHEFKYKKIYKKKIKKYHISIILNSHDAIFLLWITL